MKAFFRCRSCARGLFVELAEPEQVVATIAPCPEVYERGDKKIECPGPMVWRRRWQE